MKGDKKNYELVVLLSAKLDEKDQDNSLKEIEESISKFCKDSKPNLKDEGVKNLVYEIKGLRKAHFWTFEFSCLPGSDWKNLNLFMNRNKKVLRYLLLSE